MFCTHCGSALEDGARFCGHCGAPAGSGGGAVATAGPDDAVRERLAAGDKIGAIKLYRQQTGLGLKEAKDAVETIAAGLPPGASSSSSGGGRGLSCLGCTALLVLAGALLLGLFQIPIRMSGSYAQAIDLARDSPRVREALGEPIAVFPVVWTGRLSSSSEGWMAAYDVRLSGPKASGWLKVRATTRDGFRQTHWNQLSRVETSVDGKRVEIPLP